MKFFFISLFLFTTIDTFAFNWRKCRSFLGTPGRSIMGIGVLVSTGQFSSSWGACAAMGLNKEDQKRLFYYVNFDRIKEDAARGGGEYLETFLAYNDCIPVTAYYVKNNYQKYFQIEEESSFNMLNRDLKSHCSIR